jgi:hypothetical protein
MFGKLFRKTPEPSAKVSRPTMSEEEQKSREHDYWLERKARQRAIEDQLDRQLNIKPSVLGEDILQHLKKIRGN